MVILFASKKNIFGKNHLAKYGKRGLILPKMCQITIQDNIYFYGVLRWPKVNLKNLASSSLDNMAAGVVEFSNGGYTLEK
jgi:hypothetical protein